MNIQDLEQRIRALEEKISDQIYDVKGFVDSAFKRRDRKELHRVTEFSLYKGWVVDTLDPRKQGRVRFYSAYLHEPGTEIDQLPFAEPISWCGGFDDCGSIWVPPAGSSLCIIFEVGSAETAYYLGTMWPRDRGQEDNQYWNALIDGIPEYTENHAGHRKGYFHGPSENPNDESQVLPMWNTEMYDSYDWDGKKPPDPIDPTKVAYPHIMGFKTPQKHMVKFVDGDYRCGYRYKRIEILSSLGNWMIFKDDYRHEGGRWANPQCNSKCAGSGHIDCVNEKGEPIEQEDCKLYEGEASNKFFKHKNECRPYSGPGTPQNNRMALPQSGIQFLSISGHTMFFDDSVEEPTGEPEWEKSTEDFNFGCTDVFTGKLVIKSTTGHRIELNDEEKETGVRGRQAPIEKPCDQTFDPWDRKNDYTTGTRRNGIMLLTACGNKLELNDDTSNSNKGGERRSIFMQSTSNHTFEMSDYTVENNIETRKEGGTPTANAKRAFVRIRSGYGLEIDMHDNYSQQECQEQYLQLMAPQKGACCGPHIMRMQENPECGFIFTRAAGDYYRFTAGHELIVVGDDCLGKKNRFVRVSDNFIISTENLYYNFADLHLFLAKRYIFLIAGPPCVDGDDDTKCVVVPVATMKCASYCPIVRNRICLDPASFSDRVFVSNLRESKNCKND